MQGEFAAAEDLDRRSEAEVMMLWQVGPKDSESGSRIPRASLFIVHPSRSATDDSRKTEQRCGMSEHATRRAIAIALMAARDATCLSDEHSEP